MHERGRAREEMFEFKMSVEAILMHFETSFACEIRLIVQNTEGIQLCNEPPQLKIEQLFQPFKSVLSLYTCKESDCSSL